MIQASNALEGGRLLCWKGAEKVCAGAGMKKILQLCVAAYEKMRALPRTAV